MLGSGKLGIRKKGQLDETVHIKSGFFTLGLSDSEFKRIEALQTLLFIYDGCRRSCEVVEELSYDEINKKIADVKLLFNFQTKFLDNLLSEHFN